MLAGDDTEISPGLQQIRDIERNEFVVVLLVGLAAGGEGQIVVVADDDMALTDPIRKRANMVNSVFHNS
jgi:CheY-specific phosphatase CheX